jgi:hypothetical protein
MFLFVGIILSSSLNFLALKELLTSFIFIFISISFFLFVRDFDTFIKFGAIFRRQFIFFSAIVCIFGLIKFYCQLRSYEFPYLSFLNHIEGTSLADDYNFYTLFILIGFISLFFEIKNFKSKISFLNRTVLALLLFIFSLNVLFSYSRRGLILLLIVILLSAIISIKMYINKNKLSSVLLTYLVSMSIFIIIMIGFSSVLPINIKKNTLKILRISSSTYKYYSSTLLYRYSTIFIKADYKSFLKIVWTEKPDPYNPDSGWDFRKSTLVYPLKGENSKIVPTGVIGYKMDNTCNASTWSNNAYSFTDIASLFQGDSIPGKEQYYYASVFCFVSKDFDGTWAVLSDGGGALGNIVSKYNLFDKGTWQKLQVCFKSNSFIPSLYLYWSKFGVKDFSTLKGYIVFAYPEYRIVEPEPIDPVVIWGSSNSKRIFPLFGENVGMVPLNSVGYKMDSTSKASSWGNNAYSFTDISKQFRGNNIEMINQYIHASGYCFVSNDFDGTWVVISDENGPLGSNFHKYDLKEKGTWQKLQIDLKSNGQIPSVYLYWSKYGVKDFSTLKGYIIFAYPEYFIKPVI